MQKNILHKNYTVSSAPYQLKLPLEIDFLIPADDSVRLLSSYMEEMELTSLYQTYGKIRKNQATPRQLLKIVVYAAMNRLYSSRDIETACRRDINFMYLLEGKPAPDHATIARFISRHLSRCSKDVLAASTQQLYELGEISAKSIFIDGTKIESCANKYTFVWKKSVNKHLLRLFEKITAFVADCEESYGIKTVWNNQITVRTLKRLRKQLAKLKKENDIIFVHGSGKRKTALQKSMEQLEHFIQKLNDYGRKIHQCGNRNSYSKTDPDATFMRMKEDAMMNGQLKPAYNLQHGVDAEYVTWLDISTRPTDVLTLIPFLKDMEQHLTFKYHEIVADAGYESEENYVYLEENQQISFIKPQNYEISKKRKYKQNISRAENMEYHAEKDEYICKNGKTLSVEKEKCEKTASGYKRTVTIYRCADCRECTYKRACIKGNNCKTPFEERHKTLYISKKMKEKRQESQQRITSEYGTQLRMNRSIQAEGSFADIKEDMSFRRYLYRGKENVLAQSTILAIGHNVSKLHHKIQSDRTGTYLFGLKQKV